MMLFSLEILYISWIIFVLIQAEGTWRKILLSSLILFVGLVKGFCFICFLASDIFYTGIVIMCLQLIVMSLYCFRYNKRWQVLLGLTLFIALSIYMYYHGSVCGEMEFRIADMGGIALVGSYTLYRWATYASDVIFPFALVFNLLISPFWLRNKTNYEETEENPE